jgi:hypothetical protein
VCNAPNWPASCGQAANLSAVHRSHRRPACTTPQPGTCTTHAAEPRLSTAPLPFLSVQHDVRPVTLSNDLVHLIVCKLRAGASVSAAARAAGVSRQRVYRAAAAHDELRALLPTNAGTAVPRTPQQPSSPPASNEYPDAGDRPRVSYEHDLDRVQVGELVRALHRTGNLARAALEAGIELHPHRLDPKSIPREARDHLREALKIVAESQKPKPPSQEAQALAAWLNGSPWPLDITLDAEELRRLSPRAASDYESTLRGRAIVMARHGASGTKPRVEPEDPSVF